MYVGPTLNLTIEFAKPYINTCLKYYIAIKWIVTILSRSMLEIIIAVNKGGTGRAYLNVPLLFS